MILGADVGGTFTDLVAVDDGRVDVLKVPTTNDQSEGIRDGALRLAHGRTFETFLHGTTVATNALLERAGARTVLITDAGFEDIIEIARQDRPSLYDSFDDRPAPLVVRDDRYPADHVDDVDLSGVEAIAIVLLDAHRDAEGERAIERRLRARGFQGPISRSSAVAPEFREFERTSTTVLNAYLSPRSRRYLERLHATMVESGVASHVAVMQSSGGLSSVDHAAEFPASILLSGPAGGVIATAALADANGHTDVVSFDMGGTSTDVCRISDGAYDISYERSVAGFTCRLPSVGVHTVGAGGGSIAWIDPGGSLRVGPQSAGSDPGPACYGKGGTEATVTDAHAVLGGLDPSAPLGGSLQVDVEAAVRAVGRIAEALDLTVFDAAQGILAIADDAMARAIRRVTIEQGSDPRGALLYAFGGAGGLHAVSVAKSLDMAGVVIPPHSGVFSAVGLLLAQPSVDAAVSTLGEALSATTLIRAAETGRQTAADALEAAGVTVGTSTHVADVRYVGQAHEIGVGFTPGDAPHEIVVRFHQAHEARNGYRRESDPVEVVTVRTRVAGESTLAMEDLLPQSADDVSGGRVRQVVIGGASTAVDIVRRDSISIGDSLDGPAIIEEADATTVLGPGDRLVVRDSGAMEITW